MFRVEIVLTDADRLVEMVDAMRAWFEQQKSTPATFGYSLSAARTMFRIDFESEVQAAAFAKAFNGVIVDDPPEQRSA
jgi:hypothetical protein